MIQQPGSLPLFFGPTQMASGEASPNNRSATRADSFSGVLEQSNEVMSETRNEGVDRAEVPLERMATPAPIEPAIIQISLFGPAVVGSRSRERIEHTTVCAGTLSHDEAMRGASALSPDKDLPRVERLLEGLPGPSDLLFGSKIGARDRVSGETNTPSLLPSTSMQPSVIHVSMIQTHLPAAIISSLTEMARGSPETPGASGFHLLMQEKSAVPIKFVKFDIEPASLGPIVVRMRLTQASVEIEMSASAAKTAVLLDDLREALTKAIGDQGYALSRLDIQMATVVTGAEATQRGDDRGPPVSDHSPTQDFANDESSSHSNHRGRSPHQSTVERESVGDRRGDRAGVFL